VWGEHYPSGLRHRKDKLTMEKESHSWLSHIPTKCVRSGRTHERSRYMRAVAPGLKKATRRSPNEWGLPCWNEPQADILGLVSAWLSDEDNGRWVMISLVQSLDGMPLAISQAASAARLLALMNLFDRGAILESLLYGYKEESDVDADFEDDIDMLRSYCLVGMSGGVWSDAAVMGCRWRARGGGEAAGGERSSKPQ
jgi:hypothetical protein